VSNACFFHVDTSLDLDGIVGRKSAFCMSSGRFYKVGTMSSFNIMLAFPCC
jgi:hypothetical protein